MPLKVPSSLRFSPGSAGPLDSDVVSDLMALATRIRHAEGHWHVLETFKENFAKATGSSYHWSSDEGWAETDLWRLAEEASNDVASFLSGFFDACENLAASGSEVPSEDQINSVLDRYGCQYVLAGGSLVVSSQLVEPPSASLSPDSTVAKALSDAMALLGQSGAASAVDRAHTALHAYLRYLCQQEGIATSADDSSANSLFSLLRQHHPAFAAQGPQAGEVTKVLRGFSKIVDAVSNLRNNASLAHPNPLLDQPEARVALNAMRSLYRYIQDSVARYEQAQAASS